MGDLCPSISVLDPLELSMGFRRLLEPDLVPRSHLTTHQNNAHNASLAKKPALGVPV